jgi:hypothetical protein
MESVASVLDEAIDGHVFHSPNRFIPLLRDGLMLGELVSCDRSLCVASGQLM